MRVLILTAVLAAGPALACEATLEEYHQLSMGMSVAEAEAVLGCAGEEMSSSEMMGIRTVMLTWPGNADFGTMNAMFQDDEMISKSQFGLK